MSTIKEMYCNSCHVYCGHRYIRTDPRGYEIWVCRVCGNVKHIPTR